MYRALNCYLDVLPDVYVNRNAYRVLLVCTNVRKICIHLQPEPSKGITTVEKYYMYGSLSWCYSKLASSCEVA